MSTPAVPPSRGGPDRTTTPGSRLHFPDVPKLELDELIDQLVDRAEGVRRAQGRLRALLRAIQTVTSDISLDNALRNIAQAAVDLSGARYGALGVVGRDGLLERFIHIGMDDATVERIGPLPQGKGLLGALIHDPRPIRLRDLGDDPRSSGFPPEHPPMSSFLGVPIRVQGEVFGNLYLTDSPHGEFSAEDEELVLALAGAAGTAIRNARVYDESQRRQRWLRASVEIGATLLAPGGEDPLRAIARAAAEVAQADEVTVALLTPDRAALLVEVAVGESTDYLLGARFPLSPTLADAVADQRPLLLDGTADEASLHTATSLTDPGSLIVVPLQRGERPGGVLVLTRRHDRAEFGESDLAMAAGFAGHASVALHLADSRVAEQRLVLLEDRDRIARDLHDHVIQELFAVGMSLESMAAVLGPDEQLAERIRGRVEDIDRTIRRIRTSIFALRGPLGGAPAGLRTMVLEITSDLTPALGFPPHVSFSGPVDVVDDPGLTDDVQAVVREALANVAKHARATSVAVDVVLLPQELHVSVSDNGIGIPAEPARRSGTANLAERAERRGGSLTTTPGPTGGTVLTWKVKLT